MPHDCDTPATPAVAFSEPERSARCIRATLAVLLLLGAAACSSRTTGGAAPRPAPGAPHAASWPAGSSRWLTGYYVGSQRHIYPEERIDFSILTHIVVGRLIPTADGGVLTHFGLGDSLGPVMARRVAERARAAGRAPLLMIGGAGEHGGFVAAASTASRTRFATNLLRAMDDLGYDGIDLDWEPIEVTDRAPLLALLRDLRSRRPGMLLTIPINWVSTNAPDDVDDWYVQVAEVVDQLNVMTYDMSGAWPGWVTWHNSPLVGAAPDRPSSAVSSAERYLAVGVPRAKLGIGIPFYGTCWRGATGPGEVIGEGVAMLPANGSMSWRTIMAEYHRPDAERWDDAARVPYLSFVAPSGPRGCTFVSYENERSVAAKAAYAVDAGLGGVIVWQIVHGHLPDAPAGEQNPLLRAVHQALGSP